MKGKNEAPEYDQGWVTQVGKGMEPWVIDRLIDDQALPAKIQYRLGITTQGKRPGSVMGETLPASMSDEEAVQVIIRFDQDDREVIALQVLHQLIHAVTGHRHDMAFRHLALRLGFDDRNGVSVPVATKELGERIAALVKDVGELPFRRVRFVAGERVADRPPPQEGRMLKAACPGEGCGYKVRISERWALEVGSPICPKHGPMSVEFKNGKNRNIDSPVKSGRKETITVRKAELPKLKQQLEQLETVMEVKESV